MNEINHFAISSILNSEIVGRSKFGHGQIGSQGDVQRYFDLLAATEQINCSRTNRQAAKNAKERKRTERNER